MEPAGRDDALSELYADISAGMGGLMNQVDEAFRARHGGHPVDDVRDRAEAAFADIGMHLSDEQLDAYADAVSNRRPFTFTLGE